MGRINIVSDVDWRIFVSTGNVHILIIKSIAYKIASSIELTNREEAIRMDKKEEVEEALLSLWKN